MPQTKTPERFESGGPRLFAGLRRRHAFDTAASGIALQWREFLAKAPAAGSIDRGCFGVMCGSDATGFEYLCATEVTTLDGLPEGTGKLRVPAQVYAVFRHRAHEGPVGASWQGILEWLSDGSHESAHLPDFERYAPGDSPLAPGHDIEIWVGVRPRTSTAQAPAQGPGLVE